MAIVQKIRGVFGSVTEAFPIDALELSDTETMLLGRQKQRTFDQDRAMDLVARWDITQITAATVLIVSEPASKTTENLVRDQLITQNKSHTYCQVQYLISHKVYLAFVQCNLCQLVSNKKCQTTQPVLLLAGHSHKS